VLTAKRHLSADADIPVSEHAAGMPAEKISLPAGQSWPIEQVIDSTLVVSANDAAVALGEASGGSVTGFAAQMMTTAHDLGVIDSPVLADPAGLDDEFSNGGGDWISAWDLAVIGRAALRDPQIASLASTPIVKFTDPEGHAHRLLNHNKLLGRYEGANGLKTGYTKAAGNTLVASATRDGRTMLVVVLDAPDLYGPVQDLLDKGFATPTAAETGPTLTVNALRNPSTTSTVPATTPASLAAARTAGSASVGRDAREWLALTAAGAVVLVLEVLRRRRRLAR
jgi:serine-type D-Ala-D-Ala carboxypeptidase (penicillin-binding protein 5/6)